MEMPDSLFLFEDIAPHARESETKKRTRSCSENPTSASKPLSPQAPTDQDPDLFSLAVQAAKPQSIAADATPGEKLGPPATAQSSAARNKTYRARQLSKGQSVLRGKWSITDRDRVNQLAKKAGLSTGLILTELVRSALRNEDELRRAVEAAVRTHNARSKNTQPT